MMNSIALPRSETIAPDVLRWLIMHYPLIAKIKKLVSRPSQGDLLIGRLLCQQGEQRISRVTYMLIFHSMDRICSMLSTRTLMSTILQIALGAVLFCVGCAPRSPVADSYSTPGELAPTYSPSDLELVCTTFGLEDDTFCVVNTPQTALTLTDAFEQKFSSTMNYHEVVPRLSNFQARFSCDSTYNSSVWSTSNCPQPNTCTHFLYCVFAFPENGSLELAFDPEGEITMYRFNF